MNKQKGNTRVVSSAPPHTLYKLNTPTWRGKKPVRGRMGAKRAEASARTGTDKGCNGRRGRRRRHGHKDTKGRGDKRPRVAATSSQSIEPPRSSLCGSVSEDEKTFLSWSPNVSVRVVYVFLVTFNSHVQISCPSFKIYFLTGRYGNANRPFLVLLTESQSLPPRLTTLYYNSESKQASSLRGRRRSWRSPLLLCGDSTNRSRLYPCILTFSVFLHRLPA